MCEVVQSATSAMCKEDLACSGTRLKQTVLKLLLHARNVETLILVLPMLLPYILMNKTLYMQAFRTMHIHPENIEVHNLESPEKEVPL